MDRFKVSDGDAWYKRNKDHLDSHCDIVLDMMVANDIKPESVLEVGCADGYRLQTIHSNYGSVCFGVDISIDAINNSKHNKAIFLDVADYSAPYASIKNEKDEPRKFDLVIVNFVLHWINRERLYNAIANIDANVADGGYLIIGDFYDYYKQVPYKHREGLYTWKMDYEKIFTISGNYTPIDKAYFDHTEKNLYMEGEMGAESGKIAVLQKRSLYELSELA